MGLTSRIPLPARRSGQPAPEALLATRAASGAVSPWPEVAGVDIAECSFEGVRALTFTPAQPIGEFVYFHGGGYRLGGPDRMRGVLSRIARDAACRIIAPAYSLAPEAPFPAALHDAAAVLDGVTAELDGRPLAIGGDSAGGGLAAACCLAFGEALPMLRAAVLVSPWLDLAATAPTFARCADSDRLFSRDSAQAAAELYLQGEAAGHPLASPLKAETLAGFPPTLLIAGSAEVLLQDSLDLAARLAAQHTGVEMVIVPHMQHVSPMIFPDLPSSEPGLAAMTRFLTARLGGSWLDADPPATP